MKRTSILLILGLSTPLLAAAGNGGPGRAIPEQAPARDVVPVAKRNLIDVGMNHSIKFEGKQVTEKELMARLRGRVREDRNVRIHVSGHPWNKQGVAAMIEVCQKAGAWNISFATVEG